MKDESARSHSRRTFLSRKSKASVSNHRMKRFRRCTNLPPGGKSNGYAHSLFHSDTHGQDKFRGWAISLSPFPGSGHYWYVYATANQGFVGHKMYPAYRARGDVRAN